MVTYIQIIKKYDCKNNIIFGSQIKIVKIGHHYIIKATTS